MHKLVLLIYSLFVFDVSVIVAQKLSGSSLNLVIIKARHIYMGL